MTRTKALRQPTERWAGQDIKFQEESPVLKIISNSWWQYFTSRRILNLVTPVLWFTISLYQF